MFGQSPDEYMSERYRSQPSQALAAINTISPRATSPARWKSCASWPWRVAACRSWPKRQAQLDPDLSHAVAQGQSTLSGLTAILQALDLGISIHALPAGTPDAATRQPEDPPIT